MGAAGNGFIGAGITQSGLREHNERLLLTLLQRAEGVSGRALADQSGLSPQTVSVILRKLEAGGLVRRGEPVRGKVGKPSVPILLEPDGILSLGVKIGRRTTDFLLIDAVGGIREERQLVYAYPNPDEVLGFVSDCIDGVASGLDEVARSRICGLGIAAPSELWNWQELVGAPRDQHDSWRSVDVRSAVERVSHWPVSVVNDATAACRAENVYGRGREFRDYAYFFVAAFVGGGVVLNHAVFEGRQGNAGAFGSLPARGADGSRRQLIDVASLRGLEERVAASGGDRASIWASPQDWSGVEAQLAPWLEEAAESLAEAAIAACSVIDFEAVVIDGAMPDPVRERLVVAVREKMDQQDKRGLAPPRIEAGSVGRAARAIGAAAGPVISQFLVDGSVGSPRAPTGA